MDPALVEELFTTSWIAVAAPLLAVAALILTVRLRAPQLAALPSAVRSVSAHDEKAEGDLHPAAATLFATLAAHGGAAAIAAATAVSLGGAGAIAWVWLFGLLLAPLRVAEALLARTAPAGSPERESGSLAARMLADDVAGLRGLGWALWILVPLTALLYAGTSAGNAVADAAERLAPGSAMAFVAAVAVLAAVLAVLPLERTGRVLAFVGAVAVLALVAAGVTALTSNLGRGLGGLGRAVSDAVYGAEHVGAFSGALAGEVAYAALLHLLPPLAATGAVDGALHARARARTTRGQAAAALLGPLGYVVLTTLLGLSFVATGAFFHRSEDSRSLREVRVVRVAFETASQRAEEDRYYTGYLRAIDGEARSINLELASERGMIVRPRFREGSEAADVAIRFETGRAQVLQRPDEWGALRTRPAEELDQIRVQGQMLPRGGALLESSMRSAGGALTANVALVALLLLSTLGAAAWGIAVGRTVAARAPAIVARAASIAPALGIGLAAFAPPWLDVAGATVAAALAAASAIAVVARAREAAVLFRG